MLTTILTVGVGWGVITEGAQPVRGAGETDWSHFTGATIVTSPVVQESFVYFGDDSGAITALNKSSQIRRWQFSTDGAIKSSPTIVDGILFVGSQNGNVYAISTESGEQRWVFETGEAVNSSPTVVNGTVYIGSDDGSLYAIDAATGEEDWTFKTRGRIKSSPVVVDQTVYFGSWDNAVYAVDTATGRERWKVRTNGRIETSPTVANDRVYITSTDNFMYALDVSSGDELWDYEIPAGGLSTPTVGSVEPHVRDTVYLQDRMGTLHAINAKFGGKRWEYHPRPEDERQERQQITTPAVVQNLVIYGNEKGMYALDGGSGEIDWKAREQTSSAPIVSNGTAYFGSGKDMLAKNVGFRSASGDGSRTKLGTFGHPVEWKYTGQTIEEEKQESSSEESNTEEKQDQSTESFDREPQVEDVGNNGGQTRSSDQQDNENPTSVPSATPSDPDTSVLDDPLTATLVGTGSFIMLIIGWYFGKVAN